jgi:hypothetical protein
MTLALSRPSSRIAHDAPTFTALALFIALTALPLLAASTLDTRTFLDVSVWQKPLQFHLALGVFFITLAFFARFLPTPMTTRRWRIYAAIVTFAVIAELVWITSAASLGIASHFNRTQPIMMILYPIMGVFSIILASPSLAMGLIIWRNKATGLTPALHLSVALGLILTFTLTLIAAGTMSSGAGHLIGTPVTGARLPIVGWSREVGDLRVAHFIATHAMHIIPLAGFTGNRTIVALTAAAYTALVAFTLWQAFQGQPFLPWLG